jgi:cyclophilin family peptidyl-prolyl cis-trans isomerase/HEAT repeat protein
MRSVARVLCPIVVAVLTEASTVARGTAQNRIDQPPPLRSLPAAAARLVLAVDRLMGDRWYPPSPESQNGADNAVLVAGLGLSGITKQLAIRALGRFEDPARASQIRPFLTDPSETVRDEAARALRRALRHSAPVPVPIERQLGSAFEPATLPTDSRAAVMRREVALDAFELLALRDPSRPIESQTRAALIEAARNGFGRTTYEPSAVALRILVILHISDTDAATRAITYRCPSPSPPTCGWDIRRSGVQLLDPRDPTNDSTLAKALEDPAAPVRIEVLRKRASVITDTHKCTEFVEAFGDEFLVVRQEAVDLVTPSCDERAEIAKNLKVMANDYGDALHPLERVSLAAHALIALARFDPDEAKVSIANVGAADAGWEGLFQVRAAAAAVAGLLKDEKTALGFMADSSPNVRVEALKSLSLLRSPELINQAYLALEDSDLMLVRTAAAILRAAPDRQRLSYALLRTLARLTLEKKDTSRETRAEIFARLKEIASFDPGGTNPLYGEQKTLQNYLTDFDPVIAAAAADTLGILDNGKRPLPHPSHRSLQQPDEQELQNLPHTAIITLGKPGDTLTWSLLFAEAPISVARFVSLARTGYYDGQMFYRLVPLSFLAAGSPGANEFSGDARFLRDEVGSIKHDLGTVSMTNHGRDTGNAQFFVDLARNPEWDDEYTVFAQVSGCTRGFLDVPLVNCLSSLLEGTRITKVDVK